MDNQNIRIRLKAFDHRVLDQSTNEIVKKVERKEVPAAPALLGG